MKTIENTVQLVIEWITSIDFNWAALKSIIASLGDVCLFFIAAYTFILTIFPKKLKFLGFSVSHSAFWGDKIKISLENRALASVCVKAVWVIINDSYRMQIFSERDNGYRIISSFGVETFVSKPYTKISSADGTELSFSPGITKKISLIVETTRGEQHIACKLREGAKNRKAQLPTPIVFSESFNGTVISSGMEHALVYDDINHIRHTVLIHSSGIMSEPVSDFNSIPEHLMHDEQKLRKFFEKEFRATGLPYSLVQINVNPYEQKPSKKVVVRKKSTHDQTDYTKS